MTVALEKLVCIASIGHSGSTLLGMLLDRYPEVTAMGELKNLARFAADAERTCACGEPVANCEFWQSVEQFLKEKQEASDFRLADFVREPRAKPDGFRKTPMLSEVLMIVGRRSLWRLGAALSREVREELEFGERAWSVFEAVAAVRQTPIVVDSPTTATYTKVAYLGDPARFWAIHLMRDGRGWAASLMRRENVSMEYAARAWARRTWNLQLMLRTVPRRRRLAIRYEELCLNPTDTMARVSNFLDTSTQLSDFGLDKRSFHGVGGNPMRFRRDEQAIKLDEKWRETLSTEDLRIFEKYAGKVNRRLGYEG